jgi:hypothetical protein
LQKRCNSIILAAKYNVYEKVNCNIHVGYGRSGCIGTGQRLFFQGKE